MDLRLEEREWDGMKVIRRTEGRVGMVRGEGCNGVGRKVVLRRWEEEERVEWEEYRVITVKMRKVSLMD